MDPVFNAHSECRDGLRAWLCSNMSCKVTAGCGWDSSAPSRLFLKPFESLWGQERGRQHRICCLKVFLCLVLSLPHCIAKDRGHILLFREVGAKSPWPQPLCGWLHRMFTVSPASTIGGFGVTEQPWLASSSATHGRSWATCAPRFLLGRMWIMRVCPSKGSLRLEGDNAGKWRGKGPGCGEIFPYPTFRLPPG